MTEPKPSAQYHVNGKPLEPRSATVSISVDVLQALYQMQYLRNRGEVSVLVRLSDWTVVPPDQQAG